MDKQTEIMQLNEALQTIWRELKISPSYATLVDPIDPRIDKIHFSFPYEDERLVDQFIRTARTTLARWAPEYFLDQDNQSAHMRFKVRKSFVISNRCWGVTFIILAPDERYSLVEDTQA
ncbi:hypothetical protein [Xanthomonas albilineans]|uniref:hypothetical protein n=1 Tax=Xanthomonas albilineans TaxID=29447 RepID=UPI0012D40EEC|nr:hypothetical protein [Xanthomonas albilineans]